MPTLNSDQKLFIVQQLACFRTSPEVIIAVKEEFDLTIERQHVRFYDPTKLPLNKKLPKKYQEIFWATRKTWLEETAHVAVANQRYRLELIQEVVDRQRAAARKNDPLLLQSVEQAAKEVGGAFTKRIEISGPDGGPIPLDVGSKRKELAARMLRKLIDKGTKEAAARDQLVAMGINESDLPTVQ